MDVFIARQPIFDRNLKVYGYELLYRQSNQNHFVGLDDDQATAELIYNSFLVIGLKDLTDGAKAFINFSKRLVDSDVPYLLPKESTVVEVLEREEASQATFDACEKLRSMGYQIALDDFVLEEGFLPLIEFADMIKVEYPAVSFNDQRALIKRYGPKVKFLAEKIETREDYQRASKLGYDFFQGYFFSRPSIIKSKEIESLNTSLFEVVEELNKPEPSYEVVADIIQRDLGLSYKLLKLSNSVYSGTKHPIKSIPQALSYLGIRELYQWISLMMLKDLQNVENAELVKLSLIRGKLMELLAGELGSAEDKLEYFLTGMLSFIDILLNKPMAQLLGGLPLTKNVKLALSGEDNHQRRLLNFVIDCEAAKWEKVEGQYPFNEIGAKRFTDLYVSSLKWAKMLNYS